MIFGWMGGIQASECLLSLLAPYAPEAMTDYPRESSCEQPSQ